MLVSQFPDKKREEGLLKKLLQIKINNLKKEKKSKKKRKSIIERKFE